MIATKLRRHEIGPTTQVAQRLCALQALLYAPNPRGLHFIDGAMRKYPHDYSREMKASCARTMHMTVSAADLAQRLLPDAAPNDPPSI